MRLYGVNKDRKIYGNCQVYSPNDILMFRCDTKKAKWYLDRDLAEIIKESPLIIKLNFEPKGLGNHNKDFGLSEMSNRCVACGNDEFLTRHHVVPYCYRKFFPLELKEHNFHDVLSLCVPCHEKYERYADELKISLGKEYNSPINGETIDNKELIKYSKIASTLLRGDISRIPKERIKEMKCQIKTKFGIKRLTKKRLLKLSKVKSTILEKSHGEIVIEQITDIQSFVEMWRSHFVSNMNCKHLPKNWSIKANIGNG